MTELFVEFDMANYETQTRLFVGNLCPFKFIQANLLTSFLGEQIFFEVKSVHATEEVFRRLTLRRTLKSNRSMVNSWTIKVVDAIEQLEKIEAYLPAECDIVASDSARLEFL